MGELKCLSLDCTMIGSKIRHLSIMEQKSAFPAFRYSSTVTHFAVIMEGKRIMTPGFNMFALEGRF